MKFSWIHKRSVINNPVADPSRLHCNGIEIGSVFVKVTGPATWDGWLWMHSLAPDGKHILSPTNFTTKGEAKEALLAVVAKVISDEKMKGRFRAKKAPKQKEPPAEPTPPVVPSTTKPEEGEGSRRQANVPKPLQSILASLATSRKPRET